MWLLEIGQPARLFSELKLLSPLGHECKTVVVSPIFVDSLEEVLIVLIAGQQAEVNAETGLFLSVYVFKVTFVE